MEKSIINVKAILAKNAADIRKHGKIGVNSFIEIGRILTVTKEIAGHGNWQTWLADEFDWSESTALKYMQSYKLSLDKSVPVTDLDISVKSLFALAAPSTTTAARTEVVKRSKAGEKMTTKKVKEVIAKTKKPKKAQEPAKPTTVATKSTTTATESKSESKPESESQEETQQESAFSIVDATCIELFKVSADDAAGAMLTYSTSGAVKIANAVLERFATFPPYTTPASSTVPAPMWNDAVMVSADSEPVTLDLTADPVRESEVAKTESTATDTPPASSEVSEPTSDDGLSLPGFLHRKPKPDMPRIFTITEETDSVPAPHFTRTDDAVVSSALESESAPASEPAPAPKRSKKNGPTAIERAAERVVMATRVAIYAAETHRESKERRAVKKIAAAGAEKKSAPSLDWEPYGTEIKGGYTRHKAAFGEGFYLLSPDLPLKHDGSTDYYITYHPSGDATIRDQRHLGIADTLDEAKDIAARDRAMTLN
jgi:Protein of unknown function (DUF3102)